jgi:hypothetical protein
MLLSKSLLSNAIPFLQCRSAFTGYSVPPVIAKAASGHVTVKRCSMQRVLNRTRSNKQGIPTPLQPPPFPFPNSPSSSLILLLSSRPQSSLPPDQRSAILENQRAKLLSSVGWVGIKGSREKRSVESSGRHSSAVLTGRLYTLNPFPAGIAALLNPLPPIYR